MELLGYMVTLFNLLKNCQIFQKLMYHFTFPTVVGPFRYDLNQTSYDYTVEVRNRFKGLDLIECLMNYGQRFMTLYRRQGSRPFPRKRNAKKAKLLSEEALQIAVKRREAKSKGEKERYTHLNAEFQRIARKDKKAIFSDQCQEIRGKQ